MSEEQLKAFLAALEADTGLQDKLKAAVEGEIDTADETAAVIAIAKEAGFTITAADLLRNEAQDILELSDEELESAVGGGFCMFGSRGAGGTRAACGGGRGSVVACRATGGNTRWVPGNPNSPVGVPNGCR
jgi:predicted ribosomally synthesized peptide with nif11-like leader